MPWCPKCKNEYYDTVKICPDCNTELVESLEAWEAEQKALEAEQKLEDLYGYVQMNEVVSEELLEEAMEEERTASEEADVSDAGDFDNPTDIDDLPTTEAMEQAALAAAKEAAKANRTYRYRNNEEKAEDNKSSAYTLLGVGIIGLIIVLLFALGIVDLNLTVGSKWLIFGIMGAMFLLFIIMGFVSMSNAKKYHEKALTEKDLTVDITNFCDANLTKDTIDDGLFSEQDEEDLNEELKYFKRFEKMKTLISENFLNLDEGYLDRFVDDYYSKIFDEH